MDFEEIMQQRWATKKFNGKQIPKEHLVKLKNAIILSPSSYNSQPWKIYLVKDQETKEKLLPLSWNQGQITSCSHLFIICAVNDVKARFDEIFDQLRKEGKDTEQVDRFSTMIDDFLHNMSRVQLKSWKLRQCYIPLMSLMAQATELGLQSCPMEGFHPEQYAEVLGIDDALPAVICAVGYSDDGQPKKLRLPEGITFY